MTRACALTGIKAQSGNKVSHSNRKSRRTFAPNIQNVTFTSDALNQNFRLPVTVSTLRSVDHNGGFDSFLLGTSNTKLTEEAVKIKKQIQKAKDAN